MGKDGEEYGVVKFEITGLGVLKLQKEYPEMSNYLPHFAEA